MKVVLVLMLMLMLMLISLAHADEKANAFAVSKKGMISNFEQRIANLTEAKTCLVAAKSGPELNVCQKNFQTKMEAMMKKLKSQHPNKIMNKKK